MEEQLGAIIPEQNSQEVFQRVWKRVMAGNQENSPVTWETKTNEPREKKPEMVPMAPPSQREDDFPRREDVICLGKESLECAGLLQKMIQEELSDWRLYLALSRRVGGVPGKQLAAIGAEERRHAKRLSAAYFLMTGVRYWPEGSTEKQVSTSYLGQLRRRFQEEQSGMMAYLAAAESTTDPCLKQMFLEHAQDEWGHARQIRTLVEQA